MGSTSRFKVPRSGATAWPSTVTAWKGYQGWASCTNPASGRSNRNRTRCASTTWSSTAPGAAGAAPPAGGPAAASAPLRTGMAAAVAVAGVKRIAARTASSTAPTSRAWASAPGANELSHSAGLSAPGGGRISTSREANTAGVAPAIGSTGPSGASVTVPAMPGGSPMPLPLSLAMRPTFSMARSPAASADSAPPRSSVSTRFSTATA